jgi:hypothetical protein
VDSVAFYGDFDLLAFRVEEKVVAHAGLVPKALEGAIF